MSFNDVTGEKDLVLLLWTKCNSSPNTKYIPKKANKNKEFHPISKSIPTRGLNNNSTIVFLS